MPKPTTKRPIRILHPRASTERVDPVTRRRPPHTRNGYVEVPLALGYLRGDPVELVYLTVEEALTLAGQLITAVACAQDSRTRDLLNAVDYVAEVFDGGNPVELVELPATVDLVEGPRR